MQKAFNVLIAALLMSGAGFAQEKSESVDGIFSELMNYTAAPAAAAVKQPAPVAVAPAAVVPASAVVEQPAPVAVNHEPVAEITAADTVEAAPNAEKKSGGWWFFSRKKEAVAEQPAPVVADREPAAEITAADTVEAAPNAEKKSGGWFFNRKKEPTPEADVAVVKPVEPAVVVNEAPEPTAAEQFVQAQQGFEGAVNPKPENIAARMYPTTLMERDQRTTEIKSVKETKAAWSTDLVFRSYVLAGDACEKMGLQNIENATDVSGSFPQVAFPKGSSAIYQPKMKVLFVRNTCENFAVLEAILNAMDLARMATDVDQVEIEAKFVEVSEGTLEELGFEWRTKIGSPVELGDNVAIPAGQYLFDDALRGGPSGPAMPFDRPGVMGDGQVVKTTDSADWSSSRTEDTFNTNPDWMTIQRTGGSTPIDLLISALDQSTGSDVLSAPRIVTRSGEEATIRVGELHSYPEVYEGGSDQMTLVNVSYQDFSEKLLGVELAVTPEVDGNQISLSLKPKITELAGWQNYQLAPANSIYNHRQNVLSQTGIITHDPVIARLPIFKKREIEAEVTIADGSTIGMGGLINEKIETYEDKVPVLGSIPLIGRLFRNEGERAVKRNLLMFVTAKKVDPSGRINTSRSFE